MGCLTCHVAAGSHGDGAVRFLQRQYIVDTVTGHGDGMSVVFQCQHQLLFLIRCDTAEDGKPVCRIMDLLFRRQRTGIHILVGIGDPCPSGNFRHRGGVISGDDFHRHALLFKIGKGVRRFVTDLVGKKDQGNGDDFPREGLVIQCSLVFRQHQHTAAQSGITVHRFVISLFTEAALNDLGSSQKIGLSVGKSGSSVFFLGGKGHDPGGFSGSLTGIILLQCHHGVVVRLHGKGVVGHELFHEFHGILILQRHRILNDHLVFRDGAGLIHTEHIHTGKSLDAVHVVDQRLPLRQADDARHQCDGREKVQPFRDHSDDGADGGSDRSGHIPAQPCVFLDEHDHGQRDHKDTDPFDEVRQRPHHFRLACRFRFFRFQRQFRRKGVRAHFRESCAAGAVDDETAGHQLVPDVLQDLVGFSRDQCLIGMHRSLDDHGVGIDLISR